MLAECVCCVWKKKMGETEVYFGVGEYNAKWGKSGKEDQIPKRISSDFRERRS